MNCEEYRQAIAANPSGTFKGGDVHASGCESCSKYRDEMRKLDECIARALAIDVPEFRLPELRNESFGRIIHVRPRRDYAEPFLSKIHRTPYRKPLCCTLSRDECATSL